MHAFTSPGKLDRRRQDLLALLLILLVAGLFRLWNLDTVPPGLFGDEAVNGLDTLDVLAGRPRVFFPANFGREGLHMLVLAPFVRWLGATPIALRLPSALAGILTCLATYWLGRELLARTRLAGTLTPLIAALYLSTSYWHVHFSRFGIRGVFTPLFVTLTFAAFWHAANAVLNGASGRSRRPLGWFLLAGLFLGLGVHFYTASRLVPIFLGVFLAVQWILVWAWLRVREREGEPRSRLPGHPPLLRQAFWPVAAMFALSALVFAPLGFYFLRTPGSLTQRATAVSILNPEVSGGNPIGLLWQAVSANVLQFFVPGAGDAATFYNLPGRAVFDPATAVLALAGLLICLVVVTRSGSSPHLFLLLWFPFMLAPTFLAVDRFPTLPRALGVLPGIYFYPALALGELFRWTVVRGTVPMEPLPVPSTPRRNTAPTAMAALVGLALLWHAALTWYHYFHRWGPDPETFDAFEGDVVAAAHWLSDHPDQEVYLSTDIYRHPSFVFLHERVPLTEILRYSNPQVHFFDGRGSLPLPPSGQSATYLFTHNAGPEPTLEALPGWPGFSSQEVVPGGGEPGLVVTTLDAAAVDDWPALVPADVEFGPNLRLVGTATQPAGAGEVTVILLWQVDGPVVDQPFGLQIQAGLLVDGVAQQVAQASAEFTYRPTEWDPEGRALAWLGLEVPQDEASAATQLALRLVNQATGEPLRPPLGDANGWVRLPRTAQE